MNNTKRMIYCIFTIIIRLIYVISKMLYQHIKQYKYIINKWNALLKLIFPLCIIFVITYVAGILFLLNGTCLNKGISRVVFCSCIANYQKLSAWNKSGLFSLHFHGSECRHKLVVFFAQGLTIVVVFLSGGSPVEESSTKLIPVVVRTYVLVAGRLWAPIGDLQFFAMEASPWAVHNLSACFFRGRREQE